jgi:hypothetical protein
VFRLCGPTPFITQKGAEGEHWACGYRNIQMLCSALMLVPAFKQRLFNGSGDVPDVHGLQAWIEKAWSAGFDEEGCLQFGGSLLGSELWIGSTECVALLRYFGLHAVLVEFKTSAFCLSPSTHPLHQATAEISLSNWSHSPSPTPAPPSGPTPPSTSDDALSLTCGVCTFENLPCQPCCAMCGSPLVPRPHPPMWPARKASQIEPKI